MRRSSRVRPTRPAPQQHAAPPPRQRQASSSPLPALLLVAKFAWPLIPLALYAFGGDDTAWPEVTASDRRQTEEQLMARIATAAPEIERRLHHELDEVLEGHLPTVGHLTSLSYTRMVTEEVLRLYPPAWVFARCPPTWWAVAVSTSARNCGPPTAASHR